jgi:hypothetical protein
MPVYIQGKKFNRFINAVRFVKKNIPGVKSPEAFVGAAEKKTGKGSTVPGRQVGAPRQRRKVAL